MHGPPKSSSVRSTFFRISLRLVLHSPRNASFDAANALSLALWTPPAAADSHLDLQQPHCLVTRVHQTYPCHSPCPDYRHRPCACSHLPHLHCLQSSDEGHDLDDVHQAGIPSCHYWMDRDLDFPPDLDQDLPLLEDHSLLEMAGAYRPAARMDAVPMSLRSHLEVHCWILVRLEVHHGV